MFRRLGQQFRPFMASAEVSSRAYSKPLQRVVTDFGADHAFGAVSGKLHEHYGIEIPKSSARKITQHHADIMNNQRKETAIPTTSGCTQQIGQIDGCMLPIVTVGEEDGDKRKQRTLHWQEARLALVHQQGCISPKFDATFQKSVDDAGQSLLNCAVAAGFGSQTQMHGVGDGASWIAKQFDGKFGENGSYLIDFYHVCEYLAEAAKVCAQGEESAWMEAQKKLLKNNEYRLVIRNLKPCLEAEQVGDDKAPVRACHRYLSNRTDQLNYKDALDQGLPIGSGEIESAHRYVIQKRLKLSGAWWKSENVNPMLALRVVRANDEWGKYWGKPHRMAA